MMRRSQGFTLIEMVVAITVSTIVVGFMAMFLVSPVEAYFAQERRTELNDSAGSAMRQLEREIRRAVPDSVRLRNIGNNRAIEFLDADVARYRAGTNQPDLTVTGDIDGFSTLGGAVASGGAYRHLVVTSPGGNPYSLVGVITPPGTTITVNDLVPGEKAITFNTPVVFTTDSPTRSAYFVTGPVSYVCNLTTGTIQRYSGYSVSVVQPVTQAQFAAAGAQSSLVARDVTNCVFAVTAEPLPPLPSNHGGLVRVRMTFSRSRDIVQVFRQVPVENRR